jgi:hypothetical protein
MAKRARVHSRDLQPLIAAPKGLFAAARVQRFDWPINIPVTYIDELGRKLHVGSTREIPEVTVTVEAFDVNHNTFAYLTGHLPHQYPVSGASVTDLKNVDVIGSIRDAEELLQDLTQVSMYEITLVLHIQLHQIRRKNLSSRYTIRHLP